MSEYERFIKEFPNIDFTGFSPSKEKSLFLLEAPNILPQNYITDHIRKYKKVYTWNSKLYKEYKAKGLNVVKIPNFPFFDNYYSIYGIEKVFSFNDKIDGICLICRYRNRPVHDFDISYERVEVFENLKGIEKHCYGKIPYCGDYYRGVIGNSESETYPSSSAKLIQLNKYKFNLCFENAYHELWSWDYITEKITDCFKAGTIPVYWGCYNIEERIPKELYIDFREYKNDLSALLKRMKEISHDEYEDMTCNAHEWEEKHKLGNIEELRRILDND